VIDPLPQGLLEHGQLGTQVQPLEHRPGFAVEREHTAAKAVDKAR
jgi:hypothetical protein